MRTRMIVGSENGSRRGAMCHWQACLLLLVGGMVGCVEGRESQHELDHVIPAHWPTSAQDAANKIDERLKAMADVAASSNESSIPATQLAEIVGWLPEVLADTSLPESSWNRVHEMCETIQRARKNAPSQYQGLVRSLVSELRAAADRR